MLYEQFKKVTFVAIFFGLIASGLHSNIDYSEELSEIDGPWEKMGAIFYDKFFFNDKNFEDKTFDEFVGFSVPVVISPLITTAVGAAIGIVAGGIVALIIKKNKVVSETFYCDDPLNGHIDEAFAAFVTTAVGSGLGATVGAGVSAYFWNKKKQIWEEKKQLFYKEKQTAFENRKHEYYDNLLKSLIDLWNRKPDAIPEEMHDFCKKLYDEYHTDSEQAFEKSFELVKTLREKVLQKSNYYQEKYKEELIGLREEVKEIIAESKRLFDCQKYNQPATSYYSYPYYPSTSRYNRPKEPKKTESAIDLAYKHVPVYPDYYEMGRQEGLKRLEQHQNDYNFTGSYYKSKPNSGLKRDVGTQCDFGSSYGSSRSKVYTGSPYKIKPSYNTGLTQKPRTTCDVGTQCN